MGAHSNRKGKKGELEVAHFMRTYGFAARRGQQFSGSPDSPDVVHDAFGWHIEVKRTARQCNLQDALDQAHEDKNIGDKPVVFHRCDRGLWLATLKLEDFLRLISRNFQNGDCSPSPETEVAPADVRSLQEASSWPSRE
jgi:hypothetical protein